MKYKKVLAIVPFLLFLALIPLGYCETEVNLLDLPGQVATYFGIDEFSAKLLVSFFFLLWPTVVVGFLYGRARNAGSMLYPIIIVDFVAMGFLVALGWMPYWIFLIVCLLIALLLAMQLRGLITGG